MSFLIFKNDGKGSHYSPILANQRTFQDGGEIQNAYDKFYNSKVGTALQWVPFVGTALDIGNAINNPSWENAGWAMAGLVSDLYGGRIATKAAKAAAKKTLAEGVKNGGYVLRRTPRGYIGRVSAKDAARSAALVDKIAVKGAFSSDNFAQYLVNNWPLPIPKNILPEVVVTAKRTPKKANGGRVLIGQQGTNSAWSALYQSLSKRRRLPEAEVRDTVNYAIQRGKELNIPYEFTRSILSNAVQESGLIHNARNGSHYGLIQATWIPRNYNAKQQIDMIYDMAQNPAKYKGNRVLGYEANLLNKSYRNPSTRNFFNWTERAGVRAWNAAPRDVYDSAFDSYYKSVYANPEPASDYVNQHIVGQPDALRVAKPVILPSQKLGGLLRFISFKKGGKLRKNDKGETVPEICPKCGGKIGVFLQGEPIFKCTKCGKYFGVVPFSKGK